MKLFRFSALALVLGAGFATAADDKPLPLTPVVPANPAEKFETTHKVVASIEVKGEKGMALQTICLDSKGRVVGLVAPPKPFGAPTKGATAEVHLFDAEGKAVTSWKVPFHATAVNCGPDGMIATCSLSRFDDPRTITRHPASSPGAFGQRRVVRGGNWRGPQTTGFTPN